MDETPKVNIDEMLVKCESMKTEDDKLNEQKAENLLNHLKSESDRGSLDDENDENDELPMWRIHAESPMIKEFLKLSGVSGDPECVQEALKRCISGRKEDAYTEIQDGRLLHQSDEEYIANKMKQNPDYFKKILEFDAKVTTKKKKGIHEKLSKMLNTSVTIFGVSSRLKVGKVLTKFDLPSINAAIVGMSKIITAKEAEMVVLKEIAKKIKNVL